MPQLAPEVQELIEWADKMMARVAEAGPLGGGTPAAMRAAAMTAVQEIFEFAGGRELPASREVDYTIPVDGGEIAARAYFPTGSGPFPAYLHFHGGAWIMGSIDWPTFRAYAREVAERVGCVVLDVDYRLAPEYQFPIPVEDCYASLEWLASNAGELSVDPDRIAIGGDSAGANLATGVCLLARDRGGPALVAQLLESPFPDHEDGSRYPSWHEFGTGFALETEALDAGKAFYFADPTDAANPLASPLLADNLSGLPPTFVLTAEFDPLRDMGEALGKRLQEAGVPTVVSRQVGHIHGACFLLHPRWEPARTWRDLVVSNLQGVLRPAGELVGSA